MIGEWLLITLILVGYWQSFAILVIVNHVVRSYDHGR